MPLFYQHTINQFTTLAVWHIIEDEDFFLKKVQLKNEITHPHKRLQHLAGRYLLKLLEPDFPLHLIQISPAKKPLLIDDTFHFSVSHCGDYAAVILSTRYSVGIDVEEITPKLEKIKYKYLSETEVQIFKEHDTSDNHLTLLTLFWSAKEAMFKWYGKGSVDFKKNMVISQLKFHEESGIVNACFIKEQSTDLMIHFRFFDQLCLAWVTHTD